MKALPGVKEGWAFPLPSSARCVFLMVVRCVLLALVFDWLEIMYDVIGYSKNNPRVVWKIRLLYFKLVAKLA